MLNRVTGKNPSEIAGHDDRAEQPQVWLINTNGILFGNGAAINVGGLVGEHAEHHRRQ